MSPQAPRIFPQRACSGSMVTPGQCHTTSDASASGGCDLPYRHAAVYLLLTVSLASLPQIRAEAVAVYKAAGPASSNSSIVTNLPEQPSTAPAVFPDRLLLSPSPPPTYPSSPVPSSPQPPYTAPQPAAQRPPSQPPVPALPNTTARPSYTTPALAPLPSPSPSPSTSAAAAASSPLSPAPSPAPSLDPSESNTSAAPPLSPAKDKPLSSYNLCVKEQVLSGINADASGVAFEPGVQGQPGLWWVVSKDPRTLLAYDENTLQLKRTLPEYSKSEVKDPEAVTFLQPGLLAVVEENEGGIVQVRTTANVLPWEAGMYGDSAGGVPLTQIKRGVWNKGFEGLAWDSRRNVYYVAQEDDPQRILRIQPSDGSYQDVFDPAPLGLKDLSDIYHDASSDSLYILSQQSKTVAQVTLDGKELGRTKVAGPHSEGLSFNGDKQLMAIVSEPNLISLYASGSCPAGNSTSG